MDQGKTSGKENDLLQRIFPSQLPTNGCAYAYDFFLIYSSRVSSVSAFYHKQLPKEAESYRFEPT